MTRDEISELVMVWRRFWGQPGAPFALSHTQHWDLVLLIERVVHETRLKERKAQRARLPRGTMRSID